MYWDVMAVWAKGGRDLGVRFADGLEGVVTIDPRFCTGVFEPLRDDALISQAQAVNGVVAWPNGLDLAPDTMYRAIKTNPLRRYMVGQSVELAA